MQSIEEDEEVGEMKLQSIESNNTNFRLHKKWGCKLFHKYLFKYIVVMQEWFGQVEKDLKTLNLKQVLILNKTPMALGLLHLLKAKRLVWKKPKKDLWKESTLIMYT